MNLTMYLNKKILVAGREDRPTLLAFVFVGFLYEVRSRGQA